MPPTSSVCAVSSVVKNCLIVPKEKIAANGDYNLSGERYQTAVTNHTRFPMVPLGEVAELLRGITFGKSEQLERDSLRQPKPPNRLALSKTISITFHEPC